jgi:hypothetical protein
MTKNEIMGKVMQPFRLSLVGALGPHLFDIVELIKETISRIQKQLKLYKVKKPP